MQKVVHSDTSVHSEYSRCRATLLHIRHNKTDNIILQIALQTCLLYVKFTFFSICKHNGCYDIKLLHGADFYSNRFIFPWRRKSTSALHE